MVPDNTESGFVLLDEEEPTDFVLVDEDGTETDLVAVPDANARYPGLRPVDALDESGFVLVEESGETEETGFVIVEDDSEERLPATHPDRSFPGIDTI
jgi:hypothetical protein